MVKARRRRKKKTKSSRRKTKSRSSRTRRKTRRTNAKKIMLICLVAIVVLVLFLSNVGNQNEFVPESSEQITQEVVTDYTSGGACKRNLECFSVSCKSDIENLECVNAEKMLSYHENCDAYWDVNIEIQDFSECACIDGYCRKP